MIDRPRNDLFPFLLVSVPVAIYAAFLGWLYSPALKVMVSWWEREDFNYCYLVPCVVAYILWEKHRDFLAVPSQPSWWGVAIVALGLGVYWVGELGGEFFTLYLSCWLVVVGLCWLHLGWRKLRVIWFPLFLLVTLFPIPNILYRQLSVNLQLISSELGVAAIRLVGMTAYREGNIIDLGFTKLQVVEACNGLRYIFPLLVLGMILAYFYRAALWKRLTLIAAVVPLAILVNSGRIAFAALSHQLWGASVAEGILHDFSGWAIFMVSLLILLCLQWVLTRLPPRAAAPAPASPSDAREDSCEQEDHGARHPMVFRPARPLVALLLIGITLALSAQVEFRERVPIGQPLEGFPLTLADWTGTRGKLEDEYLKALQFSDYTLIDYRRGVDEAINFYVAYYETQRKGESIHSPETCLLGGGWVFKEKGRLELPLSGEPGRAIAVNRVVMETPGSAMLGYFWFPQRGRILTSAVELKLYTFWDALTRQRTDGALVRVLTPIRSQEPVATAEARLQAFVREAVPALDRFLPGARLD